jgi:hypothetical protein
LGIAKPGHIGHHRSEPARFRLHQLLHVSYGSSPRVGNHFFMGVMPPVTPCCLTSLPMIAKALIELLRSL